MEKDCLRAVFSVPKGERKRNEEKKWLVMVMLVLVCSLMFGTTVCAAGTGDVAGAIEGTWKDASAQIKTVVNKVVFPAIDLILAVFFLQSWEPHILITESTDSLNGQLRQFCLPVWSLP